MQQNPIRQRIAEIIATQSLVTLTCSGPRVRAADQASRVVARPFLLKGAPAYQFEYHTAGKVTHRNLLPEEALREIDRLLQEQFHQARIVTRESEIEVRINKRGEAILRNKPTATRAIALQHNRTKQYILAEGAPCDFLIRLGVMTETGKVIAARYDKYRQINRFLEMVADVVPHLEASRPLRIVDFGCGKSYLTFALYHYFRVVKGFEVDIVGLDLKPEVIAQCQAIAQDLGYAHLNFRLGDIKGFTEWDQVDMVVTLHACDTATDDALVKAIRWNARIILSVPCCQHELFRKLRNETQHPLLKHGILKERLTALITDSVRAQLLEIAGYSVQMLEFIDMEHTAKNLLIRAVLLPARKATPQMIAEYTAFRDYWRIDPYMERALAEQLPASFSHLSMDCVQP